MKIADVPTKDSHELERLLHEYQIKLGKLKFEQQAKTLKKSHELGVLKRDIARIKTILHERNK